MKYKFEFFIFNIEFILLLDFFLFAKLDDIILNIKN